MKKRRYRATESRLQREIQGYLDGVQQQDLQDDADGIGSLCVDEELQDKWKQITENMAQAKQQQDQLRASEESQISTVDADGGGQKSGEEFEDTKGNLCLKSPSAKRQKNTAN